MMNVSPYFNASTLFLEPSNSDISETLDGVPVFSFRPEDLPHYKRQASDYTPQDLYVRRNALAKKILAFDPSYTDMNLRQISELASSDGTGVHTRTALFKKISTPDLFILRRPTLKETDTQTTSNLIGIHPSKIRSYIPQEILRFLAVHTEVGHMLQTVNNLKHPNTIIGRYHSALYAETHGINEFNMVAAALPLPEDTLNAIITIRAVAAFTIAPAENWLAPVLTRMFLGKGNDYLALHEPTDVFRSYNEIRLRAAILADNQTAIETGIQLGLPKKTIKRKWEAKDEFAITCSSDYLQAALELWRHGDFNKIHALDEEIPNSNNYLADFIPQFESVRHTPAYAFQLNNGDLFGILERIYQQGNINAFTRDNIDQILNGARLFCPEIASDLKVPQPLNAYEPQQN